jgi:hypothetical protein
MAIRQLEFSVLQVSRQIDDLLAAVQQVMSGKLPLFLVGPDILMGILRNVPLNFPDGYELAVGTKKNANDYYDLVKTQIVADFHSLKLVMYVPLKTADRQFTLHKLVVTPSRVMGNKFVQYQLEIPYLAVAYNRRDYLLLSEAQVKQCTTGNVICPNVMPVYDAQTVS